MSASSWTVLGKWIEEPHLGLCRVASPRSASFQVNMAQERLWLYYRGVFNYWLSMTFVMHRMTYQFYGKLQIYDDDNWDPDGDIVVCSVLNQPVNAQLPKTAQSQPRSIIKSHASTNNRILQIPMRNLNKIGESRLWSTLITARATFYPWSFTGTSTWNSACLQITR